MNRSVTPSSVDYWFPPDEPGAGFAPHSFSDSHPGSVYYDLHPHAPEFPSLDQAGTYGFEQDPDYESCYSVYPDPRQSLASVGTSFGFDDPAHLDPTRGRSDSSASTQQSSIYTCSPLAIQAPLPVSAQTTSAIYATPPLEQNGVGRGSTRLVDSLERQAAIQGRTVPGVSFGEPPKRLVVNTRLDGVYEDHYCSPHSGTAPSPLSQTFPVSASLNRKRSFLEPGLALASPELPPTPKRFCSDVVMPITPDPTPSTYTIPGPAQPAYVYGLQSHNVTPASAVPKSMGMAKSVSRTLSYGTATQRRRPSGVPRSCSWDSLSPAMSPMDHTLGTYTIPANSPRAIGHEYDRGEQHGGYFGFHPADERLHQAGGNRLASPMSLPIDRGQFRHYPHLNQNYQSEPNSPYSAHPLHRRASHAQFGPIYVDDAAAQPNSPVTPSSRRHSVASGNGFTPTQSALLSAASMNRILAARAATGGEDGRSMSGGVQYTIHSGLHGQAIHSPTSHPLSASHSVANSPPLLPVRLPPAAAQAHFQPHAYPLSRPTPAAVALDLGPGPGAGPVEAIHPRYRDASPPKAIVHDSSGGGEDKMHACEQGGCGKKFKRLEHLRRHERTHTQDRPYGCEFDGCGRWFSRSDNLTQHRKTHLKASHGGEPVDGGVLPVRKGQAEEQVKA